MPFNPKKDLDSAVYDKFKFGGPMWGALVKTAVGLDHADKKYRDVDWLTSVVFYLHHPERQQPDGSYRTIQTSEGSLLAEWESWKKLVKPMVPASSSAAREQGYPGVEEYFKKFDAEAEEWERTYEATNFDRLSWLPQAAKVWCRIAPTANVHAACFRGTDFDYGDVIAWKSQQPDRYCASSPRHRLQIYQETPERLSFYQLRGASTKQALILSKTYIAWNSALYFWVCEKKFCPSSAVNKVRMDSVEELKLTLELVQMLPGNPIKAIRMKPPAKTLDELVENVSKTAEANHVRLKTFISRWSAIEKKYFE